MGANPGSPNIDEEIRRFEYKVEAGAELAVTQPVFDIRLLEEFLRRIEHCRIPVVAGIWPLTSTRNAEFMKNELRVSIPDEIFARMAKATTVDAARAEGVAIARDMLAAVRHMVQGAQIAAPFGATPAPWMCWRRWERENAPRCKPLALRDAWAWRRFSTEKIFPADVD